MFRPRPLGSATAAAAAATAARFPPLDAAARPTYWHQHQLQHQLQLTQLPQPILPLGAPLTMDAIDPHGIEAQEALARTYALSTEVALVGQKQSIHSITDEYAKADPIYVAKTIDLPNVYSAFRPIAGDGSCGWRAVSFAYFETLIARASRDELLKEMARISSLNNFLLRFYTEVTFIDMAEETIDLLKDLAKVLDVPGAAERTLLERFNDTALSNYIIYHMRFLAAAQMKSEPAEYQNFIEVGVDVYCESMLQMHTEIDNIGMRLLIDILLRPAGISITIAHLDRSPGSQVNHHHWPADDALGMQEPVIYLLFRPTHYDILYKNQSISARSDSLQPITVQVNRAALNAMPAFQSTVTSSTASPYGPLINIPGFSTLNQTYASTFPIDVMPVGIDSDLNSASLYDALSPAAGLSYSTPTPAFRPSKYEWEATADLMDRPNHADPAYTTNTFKNSHYNVAHFQNSNFQPEAYVP